MTSKSNDVEGDIPRSLMEVSPQKDNRLKVLSTLAEAKSVVRPSPVIRQITLGELSDEELFLPPPDVAATPAEERKKRRKTKDAFFIGSSSDEGGSGDGSESESETEENEEDENSEGEDVTGKAVRFSDLKTSTKFAKSLTHSRGAKSRPNGRDGYNGAGSRGGDRRFGQGGKMDGGRRMQGGKFDRGGGGGGGEEGRFKGKNFDKMKERNFRNGRGRDRDGQRSKDGQHFEKRDRRYVNCIT